MLEELKILDHYIKTTRPQFYVELNDPLSENQIKELEDTFNIQLPPDMKMLYSWKNGQKDTCFESFVNNSTFTPLAEALANAAEMTSMIGLDFEIENWWNKDWLPIFHNGGGDHICYDMVGLFTGQKGQLIEFWHSANDRNVIAVGLLSFIKNLNEYYRHTPEVSFDEYFTLPNIDGFPKRFKV